jgi:hypothetical protein
MVEFRLCLKEAAVAFTTLPGANALACDHGRSMTSLSLFK